jgi:hypothetical protein
MRLKTNNFRMVKTLKRRKLRKWEVRERLKTVDGGRFKAMTQIQDYFTGERFQCAIGIALAVLSIALSLVFVLSLKTNFLKGVAYPSLAISAVLLVICVGIVFRTPGDIERVTTYFESEPENMLSEEIPRMKGVLMNFEIIKIVELCLAVIGLGLWGLRFSSPLVSGIGLGLLIQSLMMFGFDYLAHSRALEYWAFLQNS